MGEEKRGSYGKKITVGKGGWKGIMKGGEKKRNVKKKEEKESKLEEEKRRKGDEEKERYMIWIEEK